MQNFQNERLVMGSMAMGEAQAAIDITVDYVKNRDAFGGKLWEKQTVRHKLAELQSKVTAARYMVYGVANKVRLGIDVIKEVSMIKSKVIKLLFIGLAGTLISCNIENNENSNQTIDELKDGQQVILKKIASLEKSVANLAVASKNKPAADNKKQQPPKADPNKVYNIEIGDSFTIGPKNAKVTIVEWMDFQ